MTPQAAAPARPIYRPIRTPKEFEETVNELDCLADLDPKEGTPAHDRMELLGILIAAHEEAHLPPFKPATPQDLVQFMADQKGKPQAIQTPNSLGRSHDSGSAAG